MFKKLILTIMLSTTALSWCYATYSIFAVKENTANVSSVEEFTLSSSASVLMNRQVASVAAFSLEQIEVQEEAKITFYYEDDADSLYVFDQILSQVARDLSYTSVYELPFNFKLVSELDYTTQSKLKSEYGFASYPAFVIYESNEDGTYPVSSLEYNVEAPFTVNEIENWLKENTDLQFNN